MFEKSATKSRPNLLKYKNIANIESFDVRILDTVNQLHDHTRSTAEYNIDLMCMQAKYYHSV